MRNQVECTTDGYTQLARLRAAAADPAEVDRVSVQLDSCLTWYDQRNDPDQTTNCGPVGGPGLLPAPHFTARTITVLPLRFDFEVDDTVRPFIVRVVRVDRVFGVVDPNTP